MDGPGEIQRVSSAVINYSECESRLRGAACASLLMLSSSIIDQNPYRQLKRTHAEVESHIQLMLCSNQS